ncbi:MAG: response regulator transcription factor [Myxococcota bacterium]
MTISVAIVEDNASFRDSVQLVLQTSAGFECPQAVGSVEALQLALSNPLTMAGRWDVVLMDLDLPGVSGIEGIRRMKAQFPTVKVVVCTVFEEPATVVEAIGAGADGYLLKGLDPDELLEQIRLVVDGGASLSSNVARTLLAFVRDQAPSAPALEPDRLDLTPREREVLRCLVNGQSYKQAAATLDVSLHTVRFHIRGLYRKLQVNNVAEAVSRAVRQRLV